jgi:hypothetical protein
MQRKSLINEALRRGLHDLDRSPEVPRPRYETVPFDPGVPALHGIHSVYDLLAFAEGEDFR